MTDKERILMDIVQRISVAGQAIYGVKEYVSHKETEIGDLVVGMSTRFPNDFLVGFVAEIIEDGLAIREIGSDRVCKYYNERFLTINKEKLGYEILEGLQYKIYRKVLKAFDREFSTLLRSIDFSDNVCTVTSRRKFEDDKAGEFSFTYDKRTKIADIINVMHEAGIR